MSRTPDKRPFALTSALLLSLFFGFWGANDGCQTLAFYRNGSIDPPMEALAVADAEQRASVVAAFANLAVETENARPRAFPLAAAGLVLGIAIVLFSLRAFARAAGSRSMLWQLALAQTALVVGSHFALPRLWTANMNTIAAIQRAKQSDASHSDEERKGTETFIRLMPALPAAGTGIRSILGVLVVLVLTRRSTREYFDAARAASEGG